MENEVKVENEEITEEVNVDELVDDTGLSAEMCVAIAVGGTAMAVGVYNIVKWTVAKAKVAYKVVSAKVKDYQAAKAKASEEDSEDTETDSE